MHIPSSTTDRLELVTFQQALEAANTPSEDYDINKWLYAPNFYSEYRYILGTRGKNPLICIGINPSTAEPDNLDNTLKSVERIAHGNGFDSFIMFNVYAQRATSPDDMEKVCNPLLHKENLEAFRHVLSISEKPAVSRFLANLAPDSFSGMITLSAPTRVRIFWCISLPHFAMTVGTPASLQSHSTRFAVPCMAYRLTK